MTSHKEQPAVDTSAEKLLALADSLTLSIGTASNDDYSKPMTEERRRHVARMDAMREAADALRFLAAHPTEPNRPVAWARGVHTPSSPHGPAEYDLELCDGEDPPSGDGWYPLFRHPPDFPAEPAGMELEAWHLGAMNDALFIINKPPRPSNDEVWHDRPDGPTLFLRTHPLSEKDARQIIDAHNATVTRLTTHLRDAQARGKGMEEALLRMSGPPWTARLARTDLRTDIERQACDLQATIEKLGGHPLLTDASLSADRAARFLGKWHDEGEPGRAALSRPEGSTS